MQEVYPTSNKQRSAPRRKAEDYVFEPVRAILEFVVEAVDLD
jgi:hypothetical protein